MKKLTQLEYMEHYCSLVSIHCNDLMNKHRSDEACGEIETLALAVSLLNSAVRSLRNIIVDGGQR